MARPAFANTPQLELFRDTLPRKPYCTDDLGSLVIRNAAHAAQMRYIQPNNPNSRLWLAFDIDRPTGPEELTDDLHLPCPTLWVQNPENNHAHALYALDVPVHLNMDSSMRAIRYAAAVDVALSTAMGADAGYTGLICKNPLHTHWRTYSLAGSYDLHELADYVDLSPYNDRRRHLPEIGLGRNVRLFESLRHWAYRAIRQGWPDYNQWLSACLSRSEGINAGFDSPLDHSEVKSTAVSVARWTHRRLTPEGFSAWQAAQGRRGGIAKGKAYESKRAEALAMLNSGMTATEVSAALSVHRNTIRNWSMHK